jgi:hypothetical protein
MIITIVKQTSFPLLTVLIVVDHHLHRRERIDTSSRKNVGNPQARFEG